MPEFSAAGSEVSRRQFLRTTALTGLAGFFINRQLFAAPAQTVSLPFANGERKMGKFPQKRLMIVQTSRPPQLETPFSVFNEGVITPNDAFFVRYHLSQVPTSIDPNKFSISITGKVSSPLVVPLAELKKNFEPVEIVAVNQCSGNSRGFSNPRVAGGQSGNGAMGNAKWKGARLKDVLAKAGVAAGAKQVTFNGLDGPPLPKTPDFVKALEVDHALQEDTLLAYEMNGEALPMLNGFPLRLIVPGYYGTYWVKHVNEITVIDDVFKGFFMDPGYRIPDNDCACVEPGTKPAKTRPIGRFNVRSFITSLTDNAQVKVGKPTMVRGIAFDGGYGITQVDLSTDDGKTWQRSTLGKDLGKYSFREWRLPVTFKNPGAYTLKVKATNRNGETQPMEPRWNPAGYMRNVVEQVKVSAVA